jgi:hypothetical protein
VGKAVFGVNVLVEEGAHRNPRGRFDAEHDPITGSGNEADRADFRCCSAWVD